MNLNILRCVMETISDKNTRRNNAQFVQSLALANVLSLAPKLMKYAFFYQTTDWITETWLKESIDDSVVDINGYNIVHRHRLYCQHGGVCLYINESMKFLVLQEFELRTWRSGSVMG